MDLTVLGNLHVHMWITLALTGATIVLFVTEWLPTEVTALGLLSALLLLFGLAPLTGPSGQSLLTADQLLAGFANPALITVVALLVVGEALIQTGALDGLAHAVSDLPLPPALTVIIGLTAITALSAFLNNTPVVVIFIPIMQVLAMRVGMASSRLMMPLSFAAILGGMTTLIGSSTNLLVSSSLIASGRPPLQFFEFTDIGVVLAGVGLLYMFVAAPRLLPDRASMVGSFAMSGKQFVAQCIVPEDSALVGEAAVAGQFRSLPGITVQMILRGGHTEFPPFDSYDIRPGDTLILAAPRKALTDVAARHPGLLHPPRRDGGVEERGRDRLDKGKEATDQMMAEVMVSPSSRLVGFNLAQIGFRRRYGVAVTGIQRRARMVRGRMTDIRLEGGDVLLVQGRREDVEALQSERDMVLISGTQGVLPKPHHAMPAAAIFLAAVLLAAFDVLPIVVTALFAATLLIAIGALNLRQASRAIDRKVIVLVGSTLALGAALEATGGAAWVANGLVGLVGDGGPVVALSAFFLLVAVFTNLLSNNACAVLFTPIAVSLADRVGVDPHHFAIATVLAANCSFATPIGYQTNLLVMGPGHYRFADFARLGLPLTVLLWLAFTLVAPWYWGLWG